MKEQIIILAASNNPDCLENIGLYTIMLAKRTGMMACLLFVLQKEKRGNEVKQGEIKKKIQRKTLKIQNTGAKANVRIDCLITTGHFVEEVAKYLQVFDSPILIVDQGDCKAMREKELRLVQETLKSNNELYKGRFHHFLVISGKNKLAEEIEKMGDIDGININQFYKE